MKFNDIRAGSILLQTNDVGFYSVPSCTFRCSEKGSVIFVERNEKAANTYEHAHGLMRMEALVCFESRFERMQLSYTIQSELNFHPSLYYELVYNQE
jgi:hypothetical protein